MAKKLQGFKAALLAFLLLTLLVSLTEAIQQVTNANAEYFPASNTKSVANISFLSFSNLTPSKGVAETFLATVPSEVTSLHAFSSATPQEPVEIKPAVPFLGPREPMSVPSLNPHNDTLIERSLKEESHVKVSDADISCDPETCKACHTDDYGGSHSDQDNDDIEGTDTPPQDKGLQTRQSSRSPDSILQPQLTSPDTWPQGPANWWGQLWAVIEHKGARSREGNVQINNRTEQQGLSSADFSRFAANPDVGGAGPIWGCTVVIVATDKGIWTSHHWEEPSFRLVHHQNGELRQGSNRKRYLGLNDLRDSFVIDREFIYVRIITPSLSDMGEEFYPQRVYDLGEHLAGLLEMSIADIKTFTYEKGHDPTESNPPTGLVSWQYATLQQVEWTPGEWVYARVLRVRFEEEIIFQHIWCGPEGNMPAGPNIAVRQAFATASTQDEANDQIVWHWNPASACRAASSLASSITSAVLRSTTSEPQIPSTWSYQSGASVSPWYTLTLPRLSRTVTVRQGVATVTVYPSPTDRTREPRAMLTDGPGIILQH